ncbi:MAG: DUF664 domain-containing protein [Acidobacteria bacterium]|nr:DUF664 domain-containing protein [Acidobacteriota bacterium]
MTIAESLLPEFDQEMANTRKSLERLPDAQFDWRPHEKSFTLGGLVTHIVGMTGWVDYVMQTDSLDYAPVGQEPMKETPLTSASEALARFDEGVAKARAALAGASNLTMAKPWTLLAGGKEVFKMPRIAVMRGMIMNHLIHHRGQLTVYMRMSGATVPALYGPSADES